MYSRVLFVICLNLQSITKLLIHEFVSPSNVGWPLLNVEVCLNVVWGVLGPGKETISERLHYQMDARSSETKKTPVCSNGIQQDDDHNGCLALRPVYKYVATDAMDWYCKNGSEKLYSEKIAPNTGVSQFVVWPQVSYKDPKCKSILI